MADDRKPRGPRAGRSEAAQDTSNWGSRLVLRAGVSTAAGGSGFAPDIGQWRRVLDVRAPTDLPGGGSTPFAMYVTAAPFWDASYAGNEACFVQNALTGRVTIGSGGVSRSETFAIPTVGKVMHVGADSLRLDVHYDPDRYLANFKSADDVGAMVGFDVNAAAALSQIDPAPTFQGGMFLNPGGESEATFRIPDFAQTLQVCSGALTLFDVEFLDQNGFSPMGWGGVGISARLPAAEFSAPRPFPLASRTVVVKYLMEVANGSASISDVVLRWGRMS